MLHRFSRGLYVATMVLMSTAALADEPIETVTVTAEKTSESILNVGINVTALSADQLRQARISTATDLATQIPNFSVKTNIPGAQQIVTVRGIGLDDFSSTNSSSVGVYVDDVFLASFAEMDFGMYDLDRVEVLKGPQGTLYGRNSTAGAINIISAKPEMDAFSGELTAGYGNFSAYTVDAALNIPISSTFALRLSGQTDQQDTGFWYSPELGQWLGAQNIFRERAQALWTPTSALTVLLKLEGEENNSEIGSGKFFGDNSTNGQPCPDFKNPAHCVDVFGFTDTNPDPFVVSTGHDAPYKIDSFNATLHITDDLGWAELTSVTGYIDFRREFYIDADASPLALAEFDQNDKVRQASEELRLAGGSAQGIEWLVGAYGSWDQVRTYAPGTFRDLLGADALITADQVTHSAALFGQVKWALSDELTLVTGLRGTYEDRHYIGGSSFFLAGTTIAFPCPPLCPTFEDATITDRNVSWHAGLNWKPSDKTLVYFSAAESTKSGGFFNGITFQSEALAPYKPEHLTDLEVGAKSSLLNDALFVDGSVFYYDYHNYQAQTFTSVGTVSLIKLSNIKEASVYGLDLGLTWQPADGLSLRAGLGLLHTRLGSFPFFTTGPKTEPAGNKMPDAPDTSFTGTLRYEHGVFGGMIGAFQFSGVYEGAHFFEALNTSYLAAPSSWVFDTSVSLATGNRGWEATFWVRNLGNEQHTIQATDDGQPIGAGYRMFNNPRMLGVTLSHRF
jgi:iron complex outermembrane receptor protein